LCWLYTCREKRMFNDEQNRPAVMPMSDEDTPLVAATQAGDGAAFEQIVSRYDRKLFRIAYHIVRNAEDAQDVVQETFIKVFQNIGRFHAQSKFSTWLYRVAVNQSLMELRKQRGQPALVDLFVDGIEKDGQLPIELSDWRPNPEEQYTESELRELLTRLLQELRPTLRVVFIMHDIEGQPLQEVAEELDLSLSAAKTRSLRARLYLREQLTIYFRKDVEKRADEAQPSIARAVAASACP
jgi:RNA polymerase sigma-70 factor (ECF subfamily)